MAKKVKFGNKVISLDKYRKQRPNKMHNENNSNKSDKKNVSKKDVKEIAKLVKEIGLNANEDFKNIQDNIDNMSNKELMDTMEDLMTELDMQGIKLDMNKEIEESKKSLNELHEDTKPLIHTLKEQIELFTKIKERKSYLNEHPEEFKSDENTINEFVGDNYVKNVDIKMVNKRLKTFKDLLQGAPTLMKALSNYKINTDSITEEDIKKHATNAIKKMESVWSKLTNYRGAFTVDNLLSFEKDLKVFFHNDTNADIFFVRFCRYISYNYAKHYFYVDLFILTILNSGYWLNHDTEPERQQEGLQEAYVLINSAKKAIDEMTNNTTEEDK